MTGTLTANKMMTRAMLLGESTNCLNSDPSVTLAEEVKNKTTPTGGYGVPHHVLHILTNLVIIATMKETVLH
jgi:hypothetical protein